MPGHISFRMKGSGRSGAGAEGADGNEGHAESQCSDEKRAAGSQDWLHASGAQHTRTEKDQFYHLLKYDTLYKCHLRCNYKGKRATGDALNQRQGNVT